MAETKPLTAYWMHDVIRISEPLTIGKHAWRLVRWAMPMLVTYRRTVAGARISPIALMNTANQLQSLNWVVERLLAGGLIQQD